MDERKVSKAAQVGETRMGARGVWESTVYDPEQGVSVKDSRLGCVSVFAINTLLSIDSNMLENGAITLPMLPGLIERWTAATKTLLAESQSLGRVVAAKHHDGVLCGVHSHAQNVRGSAQDVLKCATC